MLRRERDRGAAPQVNSDAHIAGERRPGFIDDPLADLQSLGRQYLSYAQQHPLEYRLMFSTPWPASAERSERWQVSTHAFDILRQVLRRLHGDSARQSGRVDLDAIFVWSAMHGLVGVMNGDSLGRLDLQPKLLNQAVQHVMDGVTRGLRNTNACTPNR